MEDSGGPKKITFGKGGNQGARGSNSGGDFRVDRDGSGQLRYEGVAGQVRLGGR